MGSGVIFLQTSVFGLFSPTRLPDPYTPGAYIHCMSLNGVGGTCAECASHLRPMCGSHLPHPKPHECRDDGWCELPTDECVRAFFPHLPLRPVHTGCMYK